MNDTNIVIMGKTGSGKSTIVNAVMGENVAPTGVGQPVSMKNKVYTRELLLRPDSSNRVRQAPGEQFTLNLYDTVGLELNSDVTQKTLEEIRGHIEKAQRKSDASDRNLVWFCLNTKCSRFEPYEATLIQNLSNDYEIPFVIVMTQCFSDEKGELETQIEKELPNVSVVRVLAKDHKTRVGVFPAFGIKALLHHSVFSYNTLKVSVLESKLERLSRWRSERVALLKEKADRCIEKHAKAAQNIGFIPGGCIPVVHGIVIKMLYDIDAIFGVNTVKGFGDEIFLNVALGIIVTPFMLIPFLSALAASAYVEEVGKNYRDAVLVVLEQSADYELKDNELMSERIKAELLKRKKK